MSVTNPIFIKFTLALQSCVNNCNAEFHKNPKTSNVTDTRSQTNRQINVAPT